MCMSLAIKFAKLILQIILQKKNEKRNKPETKRDFLQEEEDKDYCAFLLFIEDLYCFAVALEKEEEKEKN